MKKLIHASLAASLVLGLAACQDKSGEQSTPDTPVAEALAPPAAPAITVDQGIAADAFKLTLAQAGAPTLIDGGRALQIELTLTNGSGVAISSAGTHPVNIGVQVLPAAGTAGDAAVRDFLHLPFEPIAAGATSKAAINIPADASLAGHKVRVMFVQEGIQWFDGPTHSTLELGPFNLCDNLFCDLGTAPTDTAK